DIDFESRDVLSPVHPDNNLVGVERNMARYRSEDFLAQLRQQIGLLAEQPALVRQQDLQPLPSHGRGRGRGSFAATAEQPQQSYAHAALRPSRRFIRPTPSAGTVISTDSPSRQRVASS